MVPQKAPAECADVFAWLRQQGLLTAALAENRTRAALSADAPRLAREFAADVPLDRRAALLQWSDLLDSPRSALNVLATHPSLTVEPEALASGFEKLARTEPGYALDLLPKLMAREGLTPELKDRLERAAALGAAYDRDPRAIAAFDDLPPAAADAQVQEWRVRAALWNGDFARALAWIEQMPPALATQPRWRYWHARAIAATSGDAAAAPLFGEIAGLRDYYGYLAADRLAKTYNLNVRPSPLDAAAQTTLSKMAGMIRAHELFDCDMTDEATSEWNAALDGADNALKVQAALLASRWGWFAQSITTLAQTGEFDDVTLRYPRPFSDVVSRAAKVAQLPQDWILAVMRQESLFRKDAVSRADARGLMQMVPSTASAVARRWHLASPGRDGLFDPSIAVPLGAAHLRELLDRYGEQLTLSLAAYDAGPAAVARWLPSKPMDADVWIENIPYNETRGYVEHIAEHIVAYASVRGAQVAAAADLVVGRRTCSALVIALPEIDKGMSMRSIVFSSAAIIAGAVLGVAAPSAAFADTVVVSADRMVDVLTGRIVDHPLVTIVDGRIAAVGSGSAIAAGRAPRRSQRDDAAAGIDRHAHASDLRPALQRLSPAAIHRQLLDGGRRGQRQENPRGRLYHGSQRGLGQLR